LLICD